MNRALGWIPDAPDSRDRMYSAPPRLASILPIAVDLSASCCPVYDQETIGSCAPNVGVSAFRFALMRAGLPDFDASRLFLYYNARAIRGTVRQDSGSSMRDNFKSMAKHGLSSEKLCPYDVAKFTRKPSKAAFTDARKHQAIEYERVPATLLGMKTCLADGWPVAFGFMTFTSLFTSTVARTGIVPEPKPGDVKEGGHAVKAVGFDDTTGLVKCKWSWGRHWGRKGYGFVPYSYIADRELSGDFWRVRVVEG